MSVTFDAANKRIVVNPGVTSVTAQALYSRWKEWAQANSQYDAAFRVVGGDPIGGGLFVASYFFLINGWRVRPFEGNHTLVIDGNLVVVDGGGVPVVPTLGSFNVSTQFTVPVQAQGIATSGSTGPTEAQIAAAVWGYITRNVNVTHMNGAQVVGTGAEGDAWRAASVPP